MLRELVKSSILKNDITGTRIFLMALNYALVGRCGGDFLDDNVAIDALDEKLQEFMQEGKEHGFSSLVLYMSDGGYSRIVLLRDSFEVKVLLSPVSTDPVKKLWESI